VVNKDRKSFLTEITTTIPFLEINILSADFKMSPNNKAVNLFKLEISGLAQLKHI